MIQKSIYLHGVSCEEQTCGGAGNELQFMGRDFVYEELVSSESQRQEPRAMAKGMIKMLILVSGNVQQPQFCSWVTWDFMGSAQVQELTENQTQPRAKAALPKYNHPTALLPWMDHKYIKIINIHLFCALHCKTDSNFGCINVATPGKKMGHIEYFCSPNNVTGYLRLVELSAAQITYKLPLSKHLTGIHLWNVIAANISTTIWDKIAVEWNSLTVLSEKKKLDSKWLLRTLSLLRSIFC